MMIYFEKLTGLWVPCTSISGNRMFSMNLYYT